MWYNPEFKTKQHTEGLRTAVLKELVKTGFMRAEIKSKQTALSLMAYDEHDEAEEVLTLLRKYGPRLEELEEKHRIPGSNYKPVSEACRDLEAEDPAFREAEGKINEYVYHVQQEQHVAENAADGLVNWFKAGCP